MSHLEDLLKKKHVANHPLIKSLRKKHADSVGKQRAIAQTYAPPDVEDDGLSDMFSQKMEEEEQGLDGGDQKLSTLIYKASEVVRDLLDQFNFPYPPTLKYLNSYKVKRAATDEDKVVDAEIRIEAKIETPTSARRYLEIPVHVVRGSIVPPSVVYFDGREKLLTQGLVDHILHTATAWAVEPIRDNWASPMIDKHELSPYVDMKNEMGYQPREYDEGYMTPKKSQNHKEAIKAGVPSGWDTVIELLEKAQEDGTDTFPRAYHYILRNYILEVLPCVDNNHWEIALVNAGWVLNPYGNNRGRKTVASKQAQELEDFEMELELAGEPVEVSDLRDEYDVPPTAEDPVPEIIEWFYEGTKTPIEPSDSIKFESHSGPIRAQIIELQPDVDCVIVKSKGTEYRVHKDDISPLDSTFKKMYL
jgi:hypothetical protein